MTTPHRALQQTFAYIEERRREPITLEDLTEVSGLGRFQLIRLCTRLCGLTPMDYVRARRLAGSIPQLLGGQRIIDIALDWGFEYEQSYIRAFRRAYGITPARFRRQEQPVPIVDVPRLEGFTVSASGMLGRPTVLARPAFSLSGAPRYVNYADNLLDGTPLYEGVRDGTEEPYTAACRPHRGSLFVHAYMIVADAPGEGREEWHWPAGEWAQFQYVGLHPLDRDGARRMRLMASLVVNTWYAERGGRWDDQFIERVEREWLGEAYCEVEFLCPVGMYARA